MFDLKEIENSWRIFSKRLSEEEIIELFRSDNATLAQYNEAYDEYLKKTHVKFPQISAEEKILMMIYGTDYSDEFKKEQARMEKLQSIKNAKYKEPKKNHLSESNQKKLVCGCMDRVFEYTKYYSFIFEDKICDETIYYLLLETLINVAKYLIHSGDPVFNLYISKCFKNAIKKYICRREKVDYETAGNILEYNELIKHKVDPVFLNASLAKYLRVSESNDNLRSPFEMRHILENIQSKDDITIGVMDEYFIDYYQSLINLLKEDERDVMSLSYDTYGYQGLTYQEIADFLGMSKKEVKNIKRRALKHIRKKLNNE